MDESSGAPAIGIVGTGKMGAGMWRRLHDQAHTATVFDVSAAATAALAALGAPVADDPAALAASVDVVILSLPRSADVEVAVDGPRGVAAGVRAGAIVIDTTSGEPSVSAPARRDPRGRPARRTSTRA